MGTSGLDFGLHIETARLQEFLAQLLRSQEAIQKRQDDLASAFEELLKKLASGEQGLKEQQQTLQKLQNDTERLSERLEELDKLRIREKMERYDNAHSEMKSFESQISMLDSKIKSHEAAASSLQGRVVDVENKQSNLDDQFKGILPEFGSLKACQAAAAVQCQAAEARCTEVRSSFRRWLYQARWASEIERVKEEFKMLVPDVDAVLAGTVNPRLQLLEEGATAEAHKIDALAERNKEVWEYLQSTMERALELEHKAKEGTDALAKMDAALEIHANFRRSAEERVQSAEAMVTQLSGQFALLARDDDVKNMMKDILLIWTAVKQLDAAKADRKELENLGLEVTSKNASLSEGIQKLESYKTVQDTALDDRIAALHAEINESKSRHDDLEFMFGLVVRLVEDIANIQFGKMQTRLGTSGRLGSGREVRPALRKAINRAHETNNGAPKISISVSSLVGENDGTERGGDSQGVSDLRCRPKPNSDSKADQPSLQPHVLPDVKNKQISRSPPVAAFADWVSNVQKALKLDCSPPYFSGSQMHASR
ncbi:hypothetical protein, conserved [Eimeria praecox]|uniref:Uncharacterized protein n=1 Tax=Eimeria praecox TaxID=51316 RepID=U6H718_9EIME|nr:hypothetical protein, conserved [Eimeria praecox]